MEVLLNIMGELTVPVASVAFTGGRKFAAVAKIVCVEVVVW